VLVAITEQLANRQETKNAKESRLTPRKNILGDFENSLALFASLAVQKIALRRGDHFKFESNL